jgi:hypothetical protein
LRVFLIHYLEPLVYLLYSAIFFLRLKTRSREAKVLLVFYLLVVSILLLGIILTEENNWTYNSLFLATPCIVGWYYYRLLPLRLPRTIISFSICINLLTFVYHNNHFQLFISNYNTYQYAISFITLVVYCFLYFYYVLDNITTTDILQNFNFWLSCGYLLYFLGAFVFILFYEKATGRQRGDMWASQNVILLFSSLITLVGYLKIADVKKQDDTN